MSFPPKLVTILCLVQFLFIAMGYFITRSCLKFYDQIVPGMLGAHAPAIPPLAGFVRSFGLWLLLAPLVWSVVAASRGEVNQGIASITSGQMMIGILLTVILTLVFSISALGALYVAFRPI